MCTAFINKGSDLIAGYNLDLALGVWDYKVYTEKDMFYVGIKTEGTVFKTHGVNRYGSFGNLPYMNGQCGPLKRSPGSQRLDLLVDGYISGKYSFDDVIKITSEKEVVNLPDLSMHSLLCDAAGRMLLIEPGLGCRRLEGRFAVISNFPLLQPPADSVPWYGIQRYEKAAELLKGAGEMTPYDGINLLREVRQEGEYATRLSFVYSAKENSVYYVRNNDFSQVLIHRF